MEFATGREISGKTERKKVTFSEKELSDRKSDEYEAEKFERIKNEIVKKIVMERRELEFKRKKHIELMENWKKKESTWEIRIRLIEEKLEELGKVTNEIKEREEKREIYI